MRDVLRRLGSIKLAVVLLLALAAAMACASVYEARRGTEAALRDFYGAPWFAVLLAALGVNALASLVLRWPFRRSQTGFVIAHVSILAILAGALVTRMWGVHGRLWLRTEEVRAEFDTEDWVLAVASPDGSGCVEVTVRPDGPASSLADAGDVEGVNASVERFAADTIDEGERVVADPNGPAPAVKIRIGQGPHKREQWLLAGQQGRIGGLQVRLLKVTDPAMLRRLLQPTSAPAVRKRGKLVAELAGKRHVVDLDTGTDQVVPLGESGYRIKIRRYLPHAQVTERGIRTLTSRPANPMVEFDVIDPQGKAEIHRIFARFPDRDFTAAHATGSAPTGLPAKFRYIDATVVDHRRNMLDVLVDAGNHLHARFIDAEGAVTPAALQTGQPVATPWPETDLAVVEFLPKARNERALKPIPPRTGTPMPAAFLCLRTGTTAHRLWVRKGESYDVHIGGKHVQVGYVPRRIPMGFAVKLLAPIITHYPGTDRARTYESRVLVDDAGKGVKLERTISMNAPLKYGGYAFYQSSYHFGQNNEPVATMLSVVTDPGEPVVYVGYVGLMLGLIIALAQEVRRRSRRARA